MDSPDAPRRLLDAGHLLRVCSRPCLRHLGVFILFPILGVFVYLVATTPAGVTARETPQATRSIPSGFAASGAAAVTTQHTEPEPHESSDQRGHEDEQPQRAREVPKQELGRDVVRVLDHEDNER